MSKDPKQNAESTVSGQNSKELQQNLERFCSWQSVETTMTGSGAVLAALTKLLYESSEYAFCISRNKSSAESSLPILRVLDLKQGSLLLYLFFIPW